jgi:exopolyphosphatase / guanosine-5'-triphosphate,3'-diphosphate pyrophosphatase
MVARCPTKRTPRADDVTRVAVVDIGTNSTRLLIADVDGDHVKAELERHSTVTRLGDGVDAGGELRDDAQQRVFDTLDEYAGEIEQHDVAKRVAVLTSAVREASNGNKFADAVHQRYGLEPHVLTGDQEAQLTFLGATSERDSDDATRTLVVDIGGGSTELVIGHGHDVDFHVSTQAGVVRQTERHLHSDPPTDPELDELTEDVRATIVDGVPAEWRESVEQAIAVAGTATSLAAIDQQLEPYDPDRVHEYDLSKSAAREILDRLAAIPLEERRQTPGLHPDRAPTIVAGVVILIEVMDLFGMARVQVSEHDILRGAALGLIEPG